MINRSLNVLLPVVAACMVTLGLASVYNGSFLLVEFGDSRVVIDGRQSHSD
jgi:hypothetical protein